MDFEPVSLSKILGVTKAEIIGGEFLSQKPAGANSSFQVVANGGDNTIKVQITYQLPFEKIPEVFQRIATPYSTVPDFLASLNPSTALPTMSSAEESEDDPVLTTQNQIQILFIREVAPILLTVRSAKLKGFCYLFLYYWFALFNKHKNPQQLSGLKGSLAIMSRIPFSQMYDVLGPAEQDEFKAKIGPIVETHGRAYQLRPYKDEHNVVFVPNALSIKGWYDSIISTENRLSQDCLNAFKVKTGKKSLVDKLSPPKDLMKDSMGLYDIEDSQGLALIEVRAYAVRPRGRELAINKLKDFVQGEADWFFRR